MARRAFPYVVVDVGGVLRPEATQALLQSDIILLAMRLDFTSVRQARRMLDHFRELQIPQQRVRVIVNRYLRPRELRIADVEKTLGMRAFHFLPDDARRVNLANNRGIPVVLEFPAASISRKLLKIASSVNGHASANGSRHNTDK
jgi:pilus assembly protein CpaE